MALGEAIADMELRAELRRIASLLWIDYSTVDEEFRDELHSRGLLALRVVSWLAILLVLLIVVFFGRFEVGEHHGLTSFAEEATSVAVGIFGLVLSRTDWGRKHSRGLAVSVALVLGALATVDMMTSGGHQSTVFTALVMIILVSAAVFPLRPLSMLLYGLAFAAMFTATAWLEPSLTRPLPLSWYERLFLLLVISFMAAGLRVILLRLHLREHESRRVVAESLEALQRTQANLIASKRAASQGRLAAALSHELNNPVSVLISSQSVLERHLAEAARRCERGEGLAETLERTREIAVKGREAVDRIARLAERFERFSQIDSARRRLVDVSELVDDAVEVLSGSWNDRVKVVKDYGATPKVSAYAAGLGEVFSNVLANAANAIEGTGEIRVTTRYGKGFVWVQVADSGRGIEPDQLTAIFDPTFRVEDGRVRTGWGLFISRQIVHDHHGEFHIRSEPGAGTEVEICLPAADRVIGTTGGGP